MPGLRTAPRLREELLLVHAPRMEQNANSTLPGFRGKAFLHFARVIGRMLFCSASRGPDRGPFAAEDNPSDFVQRAVLSYERVGGSGKAAPRFSRLPEWCPMHCPPSR